MMDDADREKGIDGRIGGWTPRRRRGHQDVSTRQVGEGGARRARKESTSGAGREEGRMEARTISSGKEGKLSWARLREAGRVIKR